MTDIQSSKEEDKYLIQIIGEVDASSSIQVDEAISKAIEEGFSKIMVDCAALNYISSAGLGVFMSYIQEFNSKGITLVIYGLTEKVENVFQILGLDQLLNIVDTKEAANAKLSEV